MKEKTVLVAGTFDFFHKGHQRFILDALKLGEKLFVIVARDSTVKKIKGFFPIEDENKRKKNIENFLEKNFLENVFVFLGNIDSKQFLTLPKKLNPSIIALGYDQKVPKNFFQKFSDKKILRLPAFQPEKFKSSIVRRDLKKVSKNSFAKFT